MDHWFDDLTKDLARGTLSRRSMLGSVLKTGAAALATAFVGRSGSMARAVFPDNGEPQREEFCRSRQEGRASVQSLAARSTFKGRSLTLDQTTRKVTPKGEIGITKVIKLGGASLLEIEATGRPNLTQISVTFGSAFQGVRRATFTSTDGNVLRGEVDSRRLTPFRIGEPPSSVKFVDGGPPPTIKVDNDIAEAIRSIHERAIQIARECNPRHRHHARSLSRTALPSPQGDVGHGSHPSGSVDCLVCEGECMGALGICTAGVGGGCAAALLGYWVCLAAGEAVCLLIYKKCWDACHDTGNACCPVSCGDVACCDKGETCLNAKIGICCSEGLIGCGNKHCCQPTDTCISATGFCCPAGRNVCNDVCCKIGEVCKNNKCCPEKLVCGNVCCADGMKCADATKSLCCSLVVDYCNGVCCNLGEKCINGKCCSKPCGTACCGANEACQNGKCVSIVCADGLVTCIPKDSASKEGAAMCCPPNVSCCLGKCCKPSEICCGLPGTPFGCHYASLCIH